MAKKKIFITGGSGLLGSNLAYILRENHEVYATYNTHYVSIPNVTFMQIDLTDEICSSKIASINPDCIIHCAALTNIDQCETDPDRAYLYNVTASKYIAQAAQQISAYLMYVSTDAVYNGFSGPYSEDDETQPINVYGKTKLEAEKMIGELQQRSCIVRTNFYGWNKINKFSLAEWVIDRLSNNGTLPGFTNVVFNPLFVNTVADILMSLYSQEYTGIVNVGSSEICSKYEFAQKIADVFNFDKSLIQPVSVEDVNLKAPRSKDLSLNVTRLENLLGIRLPDTLEGLNAMKQLRDGGYVRSLKGE